MEKNKLETSEFNEAVSFLNRLNLIFYSLINAKVNQDLDMWNTGLINLYSELYNDIKEKERDGIKAQLKSIMEEVDKYRVRSHFPNSRGNFELPKKLYWSLLELETILRNIYNRAGYQTRRKDDAARALR